jgi:hypothetical protein
MNQGQIYKIKSPSGKVYIGQCVEILSNGKAWGYKKRFKQHITDATNGKDYCRLLNNAIRKYSSENMILELIHTCEIQELDFYENYFIEKFESMTPNGYNLTTGKTTSRQSDETKELRRQSMIGKNTGKRYPKRPRINESDNDLPKYLRRYQDSSGKEGYRISNHPLLNDRTFVSKKLSMEEKLQLALTYLQDGGSTSIRQLE